MKKTESLENLLIRHAQLSKPLTDEDIEKRYKEIFANQPPIDIAGLITQAIKDVPISSHASTSIRP